MKRGKKYRESVKLLEKDRKYNPKKALDLCLQMAKANFDETIEVHYRLGVDSRQADQQVRGTLILPKGTGKSVKVLVICRSESVSLAKEAGADYVGGIELLDKVKIENWFDFDVIIASPDMMSSISKYGKLLGPKGLMPNPKLGTVAVDIAKAVKESKAGKIEYRLDKANIVHCFIGKKSFSLNDLYENFKALTEVIIRAKPTASKGQYLKSCYISSTMGLGIRIDELDAN